MIFIDDHNNNPTNQEGAYMSEPEEEIDVDGIAAAAWNQIVAAIDSINKEHLGKARLAYPRQIEITVQEAEDQHPVALVFTSDTLQSSAVRPDPGAKS